MGSKRLKVKPKKLDYLRCEFKIYPKPHGILEACMWYKDKACVGSFPIYGSDVMDEETFTEWVQPYVHRMFNQLKEAIGDAK